MSEQSKAVLYCDVLTNRRSFFILEISVSSVEKTSQSLSALLRMARDEFGVKELILKFASPDGNWETARLLFE